MATTITRGKYVLVRADLAGDSAVLTDGAVAQTDGQIVAVGTYDDLRTQFPDAEVVGNGRQFLMPGMVNAHHHGRGLSGLLLGQPDGGLETWINHAWGRRAVEPYNMMLITLLNLIRSGITTVMFNQSATARRMVWDEAQANLRAFDEAGVRTAFSLAFKNQCYLVYGNDDDVLNKMPDDLASGVRGVIEGSIVSNDDYFAMTADLIRDYPVDSTNMVRVLYSPQSYHWADEDTLAHIAELARAADVGIHTHCVESYYQRLYAERLHGQGQTPTRRLYELGFLGPKTSFAHGVWLTEDDMALMVETGTSVSHNPSSNLRLRSGIAPVLEMHRQGVHVALGTDSTSINDDDDHFQEMALAMRLHRPPGLDVPHLTSHQVLHMATLGGAYETTFGEDLIGSLEVGKRADMVLLDWDRISTPYVAENLDVLDVVVSRARASDVETVIVEGKTIFEDKQFKTIDAAAVVQAVREELGTPEPEDLTHRRDLAARLEPYLRDYYADWNVPEQPMYHYQSLG